MTEKQQETFLFLIIRFDEKLSDYKANFIIGTTIFKEPMRAKIDLTMDMDSVIMKANAYFDKENGKDMNTRYTVLK